MVPNRTNRLTWKKLSKSSTNQALDLRLIENCNPKKIVIKILIKNCNKLDVIQCTLSLPLENLTVF